MRGLMWDTYDLTEAVGDYKNNSNNFMQTSQLFTISWTNVKSALVLGAIIGFLGVSSYVVQIGDIFKLDWHVLVNIFVLAAIASIGSTIKNFFTTTDGNFLGIIKVK